MSDERFTDRSRRVMQFANQEALRMNHEYIGTEHILLGILKEGAGIAFSYLYCLGAEKIKAKLSEICHHGPDMVTMGKLPQAPRAKKVIEYAMEEARNLNHNYVGTEHLLLGLLREQEGVAEQVLMNLGVSYQRAVDAMFPVHSEEQEENMPNKPELTQQQLVDLILSEYTYWRDADDDQPDDNPAREQQLVEIQIGAMAACSNILCAVLGHPAKWHSKLEGK